MPTSSSRRCSRRWDLKKRVFADLDRIAKPGAILATNTSTLDVNEIAAATKRPQDVLGTHFFSPANVMKLLEIVRGEKTAFDALATAIALGRRMAKVPVVVGVCYGFVGNRMLHLRSVEAERLILEGALPQDVDAALTEFGFPMGPFAMSDLAGIDVGWRIRKGRGERAEISDTLAEMGRFGQKTGSGYFRYEGGRTPIPDPEVEKIIIDASNRLGIQRRTIDSQEILERLIFPMINEGARILEEGIAYRPGDIDVVWVYGYGWPVWRGGPMFYADQVGLRVHRRPPRPFRRAVRRQGAGAGAAARAPCARGARLRGEQERGQGGVIVRSRPIAGVVPDAPQRAAVRRRSGTHGAGAGGGSRIAAARLPGRRREGCARHETPVPLGEILPAEPVVGRADRGFDGLGAARSRPCPLGREPGLRLSRPDHHLPGSRRQGRSPGRSLPRPRPRTGLRRRALSAEHALSPDRLLRLHEGGHPRRAHERARSGARARP